MSEQQQYITRQRDEEQIFALLQQKALDEFGRLSGEVWTDFNPHDPGITLSDAVNYALSEVDYKLNFDLEDYLVSKDQATLTGDMGLYAPSELYPTAAVTAEDYRNLIIATFPRVENVIVTPNPKSGTYDFSLRLSKKNANGERLKESVRRLYNSHRNLCEDIGSVTLQELTYLDLNAEIEIEAQCDATEMLIDVFYRIRGYLSGSVSIERKGINDTTTPDEWYDGVTSRVRVSTPKQRDTQDELYWELCKIKGVKYLKYCFLRDDTDKNITDFHDGYAVNIPTSFEKIIVKIGDARVDIDPSKFQEGIQERFAMRRTEQLREWLLKDDSKEEDKDVATDPIFDGVAYKNFYSHYPIFNDLPRCYKDEERGAFFDYTTLFDSVIRRGLEETASLKDILSLEGQHSELRVRYFDFLERLYGVAPLTQIVRGVEPYALDSNIVLEHRTTLLRSLPSLIKHRGVAANREELRGVPPIKRLISLILDMSTEETAPVSNVLPTHNIILMDDHHQQKWTWNHLNSMLIDDTLFNSDSYQIEADTPPQSEQQSIERVIAMWAGLQILSSNLISGGLFRSATRLDNYRVVKSFGGEWLLICWSSEEKSWLNLGRSLERAQVEEWANTLQRYFTELNRACERVYIVERRFFDPTAPFTLRVLFSGWSARTAVKRFRSVCSELIAALTPAHINVEIEWLSQGDMAIFEHSYFSEDENFFSIKS